MSGTGPDGRDRVHHLSDVAPEDLPLRLARIHAPLDVDTGLQVELPAEWYPGARRDVLHGAGFRPAELGTPGTGQGPVCVVRERTLADTVGPGMRLLCCGLNPSLYAADAGIAFARPGNRFWPALALAGLTAVDRDPQALLASSGIGLTDLVKRATRRADELGSEEYRDGLGRLARLAAWLRPAAICFVGLSGWRAAVDRSASAGPQPQTCGGCPVYVMPSTSGLNAHAQLPDHAAHLAAAAQLGEGARSRMA